MADRTVLAGIDFLARKDLVSQAKNLLARRLADIECLKNLMVFGVSQGLAAAVQRYLRAKQPSVKVGHCEIVRCR